MAWEAWFYTSHNCTQHMGTYASALSDIIKVTNVNIVYGHDGEDKKMTVILVLGQNETFAFWL